MPVLVLFALALTVGLAVGLAVWRYPRIAAPDSAPALDSAEKVGETVGRHRRLRTLLKARLDPSTATGLALTVALLLVIGCGVLFGALTYLVRTQAHLAGIDKSVAEWGSHNASRTSLHVLDDVTQLGSIYVVVALCLALSIAETVREKTVWVVAFIVAVMGGEEVLTLTVKQLVDRLRPTFNPSAATLGPSFPSGHSATSAAFYATAALLLGRGRMRQTRAVLTGLAAGLAVGVAASRVLLDVHWLTDVIAGLALGWAWFALCAIAFGGRILHFGAAAQTAARTAKATAARSRPHDVTGAGFDSFRSSIQSPHGQEVAMQLDRQFVLDELEKEGKSQRVQEALDQLPEKVDHEQHAALLQKFGLDPGRLAEKAAKEGLSRL